MNATVEDAARLGRLMALNGCPRETSFIGEELREAFFKAYDEAKASFAETDSKEAA